jgi:hypothetical protein
VSLTQNPLAFNRKIGQPLGTLPQFPITLGGKTIFIDVVVVQDPLDFNLLLGRDYVCAMKSIVSIIFRVISFPHDGRVVSIDQLSFVGPDLIINLTTSLNGYYMQTISPPPQVNYVVLSLMLSATDADEALTISSIFYDLDPVVDMVISSVWLLDPVVDMVISSVWLLDPDLLTPIAVLDMCSFQSVFLPSSEDLLESMIEFCTMTWFPSGASFSWNP